jgi:predicted ester cyclase
MLLADRTEGGSAVSAEDNKALVRRFYEEVWNRGNTDFAFEVFADNYVRHDFRATDAAPGPAGQKKIADDFRAAFPDLAFTVDIIVGEQDYVVGRWTAKGTHSGRWGAIEPSGRHVTFSGANIFRFEGGKVAEIWNHRDDLGLREQVGAAIYAGAAPEN